MSQKYIVTPLTPESTVKEPWYASIRTKPDPVNQQPQRVLDIRRELVSRVSGSTLNA
jgi:hypothetical protein